MLAELTDVMSDGISQDLWLLSVGIDNNPWGQMFEIFDTFLLIIIPSVMCADHLGSHSWGLKGPVLVNWIHIEREHNTAMKVSSRSLCQ